MKKLNKSIILILLLIGLTGCPLPPRSQWKITQYSSDGKVIGSWVTSEYDGNDRGGGYHFKVNGSYVIVSGNVQLEQIKQ